MGKWGKRIGYGIGDLGCNLVFSTMASYLMVFYTDVFGITAAAAGTMMLVTKFIDAVTDTGPSGITIMRIHIGLVILRIKSRVSIIKYFFSLCFLSIRRRGRIFSAAGQNPGRHRRCKQRHTDCFPQISSFHISTFLSLTPDDGSPSADTRSANPARETLQSAFP